jgi:hypothetical protein
MCDPTVMAIANFGLQASSAMTEYQGQQAAVDAQNQANAQARLDSQRAYGEDLTRIEAQRIQDNKTAASEALEISRGKQVSLAKARASAGEGTGEVMALLRDIGYGADYETNTLQSQAAYQNKLLTQGRDDAYASMQRMFRGLSVPTPPSSLGLGLQIGAAGLGSYSKLKKGDFGEA